MSTLNTQNITNGTDSITVEGAVKGSAKAWVSFNGTGAVAIRAAYNVSSITDNGTGDYTVNFTTAMADANYAWSVSGNVLASYNVEPVGPAVNAPTTTAFRLRTSSGATLFDFDYVAVAIFR